MVADVHGRPVTPLVTADQSAVGAAMIAAVGTGAGPLAHFTRAWPVLGPTVYPDPERHRRYAELFPIYRAAYAKHRDDFAIRGRVQREGAGDHALDRDHHKG